MNNKKTYLIPVEISNTQYVKVEAFTESQAIQLIENSILNSNIRQCNDVVKIDKNNITCEQDDVMIDNLIKDFNLSENDITFYHTKGDSQDA